MRTKQQVRRETKDQHRAVANEIMCKMPRWETLDRPERRAWFRAIVREGQRISKGARKSRWPKTFGPLLGAVAGIYNPALKVVA